MLARSSEHTTTKLHIRLAETIVGCARSARSLAQRSPFTLQTGLFLAFTSYLLLSPVPLSSDIVSASLAYGLLTLASLISIITLVHGLRIKRRLSVDLIPPDQEIYPGRDVLCVLRVSPLTLLPGTFLECRLEFAHPRVTPSAVRLFGSFSEPRPAPLSLTFPHRGNWHVAAIRCFLGDSTGFVRLTWTIPMQSSIIVAPPIAPNTNLPLISSTQRPDDHVPDTVHRYGDPFDIKPYHPTDGIKKIVWKAFAKSGELLSRHPEPAMTPEGFVAVCVLAKPDDDELCGKAISYITALKELTLEVLVGCEGHSDRELAKDPSATQTLLIDSVWDSVQSTRDSLKADLQAIIDESSESTSRVALRSMVLFCSGSRLADNAQVESVAQLAQWLSNQGIEPVFFLTEPTSVNAVSSPPLPQRARALLIEPNAPSSIPCSPEQYQRFLSTCLAQQWRVFV